MSTQKLLITFLLLITSYALKSQDYEVLFLQQQYNEIIEQCTPPKTPKDVFWLAQALDHQGKTLEAISILEANNDTILSSLANQLKADLYYKTGQYLQAIPYYNATSNDNNSFKKLMTIYEFNGKYLTAIGLLKNRLTTDSTNLDYLRTLGSCYYKSEATIMAIRTYDIIYSLNPKDLSAASKLAILNYNRKKEQTLKRAIDIAGEVLENDSTNSRFLRIKGKSHYVLKNYHEALACFTILHNEGSKGLTTLKHLGICEYKTAKYEEAKIHLQEAYLLDPEDPQTNLFIGKTYLEMNQISGALNYFKRMDTLIQPSNETMTSLLWEKQRCYRELENFETVDSLLHELTKYDPKSDYYFYIASNHERSLKNPEKALYYYEKFMEYSATPQEIKKTKNLRELAQGRIDGLKEADFWKEAAKKQ